MRTLAIAIIGMLIAGSGLAYPIWVQLGQDIDGVADYDFSGSSVSLSTDGNIVAIGASGNDGNGDDSGHVRIYQWNETQWIQRGNDIDAEAEEDFSGGAVSLSSDGNIVAIGALGNDGNGEYSGHVRIYQWGNDVVFADGFWKNEAQWIQRGNDIDGETENDFSGSSVALSTDGNIVAIGAYGNNGNGEYSGHVRIYQWNETQWIQRGNDIDGETEHDGVIGSSVSLSTDGNIVAIGASGNDGNGDDSGHVRIYQWNETQWIQRGNDIDGEAGDDRSGSSVSLSTDGNIVAIGAYGNDGNGVRSGHVRIYQWNETQWIQRGNDIDGEAGDDHSGSSVSLSTDGNIVAIGARRNDANGAYPGHVRIYQLHFDSDEDGVSDADDQCADTLAGQTVNSNGCDAFQQLELVNQQLQTLVADLQTQVNDISLTPGPQGPQGKVGAAGTAGTDGAAGPAGADADCVACADVANGAVDLACLILGENLPTRVGQIQAAATVILNTLLISTNICETDCNIGAEIDALIDAKMNP